MFYGLRHIIRPATKARRDFESVYRKYQRPIFRYVRARISNPDIAEEITQEVFLKAYKAEDTYNEEYAYSTWLWTIAKNAVFDHLRGVRGNEEELAPLDDFPSPWQGAEEIAIEKDERRSLLRMMRSLTRLQKRVLWLRIIHQLSYNEISSRLGISLAAVKNLVYRSKLALSEQLGFALPGLATI